MLFPHCRVEWQDPIEVPITDDYTLYSVPLPGSGSVLAFILNMLRDWIGDGTVAPTGSNLYWHRIVETFKYAYAKRTGLGDLSRSNLNYDIREVGTKLVFISLNITMIPSNFELRIPSTCKYDLYSASISVVLLKKVYLALGTDVIANIIVLNDKYTL